MGNEINLCGRLVGEGHSPFVIAEIGINHEGNFKKAKRMVLDAQKSGAECVKFQCHVIEDEMIENNVVPSNAKESIWNIMKRCSLSFKETRALKNYAEGLGMICLITPFSRAAADVLEKLKVCAFKIGSGECNNYPLVEHIASFGKPVILSTGMNDIKSISESVKILEGASVPFALLHCTSMYPTPFEKVRLGALNDLKKNFPNAVLGLSDHSIGNFACFAAVALGASILEKHFTSDKNWPGPDIAISVDPKELKELIVGSEAIYRALGGTKTVLKEEQPTINFAFACVVSIKDIKKGDLLDERNIWVKRPGTGAIMAKDYYKLIGRKAKKNIPKNTQINWGMLE